MNYRNFKLGMLSGLAFVMVSNAMKPVEVKAPKEEFDVNKVVFIEEDQDWELGFDTTPYLPENFDPHMGEFSLSEINYIDECDTIDLNFDTSGYLPEGFDPYIQ